MTEEKRINLTVPPKIIYTTIFPKTMGVLKESLRSKLEIDQEKFLNEFELIEPSSIDENDWNIIATALVRIIPRKGVDQTKITEIKEVYVKFPMFWKNIFITHVKTTYLVQLEKLIINNLDLIIDNINSNICKNCMLPKKKCRCPSDLNKYSEPSGYPFSISNSLNQSISSDLSSFSYKEPPPPKADFGKFDSLIAGIAKTMKLKSITRLRERAHIILAQNPSISEEDLAKELLKNGS